MIDYTKIKIQKPIRIKNLRLIFEAVRSIHINPFVENKFYYNIYEAKFGEGNKPIYIITKPDEKLDIFNMILRKMTFVDWMNYFPVSYDESIENVGEQLEKIHKEFEDIRIEPDKNITEDIIKKLDIGNYATNWSNLWNYNDETTPIFFTVGSGLEPEVFEKIIKEIDMEELFDNFILENQKKDENLVFLAKMKMVCLNRMKYNPHGLWITNTKTGKSILCDKSGMKYDSGSGARLLGYASADKIVEGELNGKNGNIACDEITEAGYPSDFFDALPNILEEGKHITAKGSTTLKTITTSTFTFATNPKELELNPEELMIMFDEFLGKFTESPQRIGSRIGIVWFGNNYEIVKKDVNKNLTEENLETNKIVVQVIMNRLSEIAQRIMKEEKIINWLEEPLVDYKKDIPEFLKEGYAPRGICSFWLGNMEAYRHIRGGALQKGIFDYAIENKEVMLNAQYNVDRILRLAEENLNKILDINIQSLRNMLNIVKSYEEYAVKRFEKLKGYKKVLVALIGFYYSKNEGEVKKENPTLLPFLQLKFDWDALPEEYKFGRYNAFSKLEEKIPKKLDSLNSQLRIFGFTITRLENELYVKPINQDIICISTHIQNVGKEGNSGNSGNEDDEDE